MPQATIRIAPPKIQRQRPARSLLSRWRNYQAGPHVPVVGAGPASNHRSAVIGPKRPGHIKVVIFVLTAGDSRRSPAAMNEVGHGLWSFVTKDARHVAGCGERDDGIVSKHRVHERYRGRVCVKL